jgi:uncharacterized cupin superfamily protein
MLSCATFQPNSTVPTHSHPHEQTGIVVEGELELTIGSESRIFGKGDAFTIPGNIEHSAASGDTATTIIDTFSLPREDYMQGRRLRQPGNLHQVWTSPDGASSSRDCLSSILRTISEVEIP